MRKALYIFYIVAIGLLIVSCSTRKNTARTRAWHSFSAKYNTYYNGKLAYIDGALEKEKGNKDDFTEQLPLFTVGNKKSRETGKGNFTRTVEKMEKTIKQHSIKARPEWKKQRRKTQRDIDWLSRREYNPFLWKAWQLMGQAQFQMGDFEAAVATFGYMARLYQTQPVQNAVARGWLARSYAALDWIYEAEDIIRNMSRDSIPYQAERVWDETFADYYLRSGELDRAVPYLRKTIRHEKRKTQKAREWFLMGQVQGVLGNQQLAYKAYQKAIRQNPPYELEFNARIAQTEVLATTSGAKKMISRLKRMARSDKNADYLDQVYYAMGNIYLMQKDTTQAIAAYEKGNEKATRSGTEKGVLLLKLGDLYWVMEKYNDAQRCYGEAIGLLDKERPGYEELAQRSKVLDELVPYTDAVHLQDSLQELAKMPEKERLEAIDRVIEELKKKEKEEAAKAREAEVEQALAKQSAQGNRNQRQPQQLATPQTKDGSWYFYNQLAVTQGKQTFQKQWGKRENVDDWQRVNRTVVALNTDDEEAAGAVEGAELTDSLNTGLPEGAENVELSDSLLQAQAELDSLASDPHNREYYLAQIPFTEEQVQESNLIIMDGLYNSGVIFKDKLENLGLAKKQLTRVTGQYPDYEQMDLTWYHLFLLYSRQGDKVAADSCLARMVADYPESEWTILLNDPYFEENARFGEHIEDSIYGATYDAFKLNDFETIAANAKLTEERFPLGLNRPKFLFISGLSKLNQGDALGCVDDLKAVVEKYPQSEVSELAGMIVKGVQEGRQLYGGKFDLDDIWTRRDITLAADTTNTDTLSADRNIPFVFMLMFQPDSVEQNQLLYEMARFNFSNFLVRNFDLNIEPMSASVSRLIISGFLNYDEALQYTRQLYASEELSGLLRRCRSLVISETNLALMGTRFSFQEYDEFYEKTFMPLEISNEELLQIPEGVEQADPEDFDPDANATGPAEDNKEEAPAPKQQGGGFDFDDDFF